MTFCGKNPSETAQVQDDIWSTLNLFLYFWKNWFWIQAFPPNSVTSESIATTKSCRKKTTKLIRKNLKLRPALLEVLSNLNQDTSLHRPPIWWKVILVSRPFTPETWDAQICLVIPWWFFGDSGSGSFSLADTVDAMLVGGWCASWLPNKSLDYSPSKMDVKKG